jgi:tetratricopeptide (TPR) repeat protein
VEHFERAVRLDSLFAPAYAGLSDAHSLIPYYFIDADPLVHFPLAEQFARRAIDVDDQAAEGHTSLAVSLLRYGGDYEQSEEEFLRAIDLSPSLVVARKEYSTLLSFLGRHDEAVEEAYRAVELDPLSAIVRAQLGAALQRAGRDVVAISALQEAIRLDPGVRWAWEMMGWTYLHMGRFDKACESLSEAARLDEADPEVARHLCEAARQWVATGRAVPLRPEWVSSQRFHLRGRWLALSGNIEKAVDLWESQVSWLGNLEFWNPLYDNLRDHPRFQALLEKYEKSTSSRTDAARCYTPVHAASLTTTGCF